MSTNARQTPARRYAKKWAQEIWFVRMDTSSEHDLKELAEALYEAFLAGARHGRRKQIHYK